MVPLVASLPRETYAHSKPLSESISQHGCRSLDFRTTLYGFMRAPLDAVEEILHPPPRNPERMIPMQIPTNNGFP